MSREKFAKKCRNNSNFQLAVNDMDNFIADPQKYKSNAVARVITVKKEADIERFLGIKVERKSCSDDISKKTPVAPDEIQMLNAEKVNFIKEIVSLKSLNQELCFQSNEQKKELVAIKAKNCQYIRKLEQEIEKKSLHLKLAESELAKLKKKIDEDKANDKKVIDKLILEKRQLTARVKQLQSCSSLNENHADERDEDKSGIDSVYEVEKLIADEKVGKVRYYLVRWKGFGRDDDTWEKEQNLSCPKILAEYKKLKF